MVCVRLLARKIRAETKSLVAVPINYEEALRQLEQKVQKQSHTVSKINFLSLNFIGFTYGNLEIDINVIYLIYEYFKRN